MATSPHRAEAEFLLTMESGGYQHTNSETKVILGTKENARGIFIMGGLAISPQEFNLEITPKAGVKHVFIKFDEDAQPPVYSELMIGSRSYAIKGNLSLQVGNALVGIDNTNPYLSVVASGGPTKSTSILGFSGVTEIVKADGPAATILAANQLNDSVAALFRPYHVEDNELTLNGKPVTTASIGTFIKHENVCLQPSSVIVTAEQLKLMQTERVEEARLKIINNVLRTNKQRSPLKGHLVLRSDLQSAILLNIADKNVSSMTPTKSTTGKRKICVISELPVG